MKLRLALVTLLALLLAVASGGSTARAAPALQLPWPTGHQHRINGGYTYGCMYHTGSAYYAIDFAFGPWENVSAVSGGTATRGYSGSLGNYVIVAHDGGYVSYYAHLYGFAVSNGQTVSQGQTVGYAGDTGWADGVHLHFLMQLNGAAYRPEPMSGVSGFGWYGYSVENGVGCGSNPNDPSPSWTSRPPDVRNVLTNASFETGTTTGWDRLGDTNYTAWDSPSPHSGSWFMEMNTSVTGGSVYQDVSTVTPSPGESYVFSVWARSPTGACVDGRLSLWGLGNNEQGKTEFKVCSTNWAAISAPLDVTRPNHNSLRAQIYLFTLHTNFDIDSTEVIQVANKNASFEREDTSYWQRMNPGATNWNVYKNGTAKSGLWYLQTNTSQAGSSIYQDMQIVLSPGESHVFSVRARSPTGACVDGRLSLWGLGGGSNQQGKTSFTVCSTNWAAISTPLDVANSGHTALRAQIYLLSANVNYDFDGTRVYMNSLSYASFERSASLGAPYWQRLNPPGGVTNWARYKNGTAKNGAWYLQTNTTGTGGSIFQDVTTVTPSPGESYVFSVWARERA